MSRRPGRAVGGIYAAAAGVLIVAVLAVAYGTAAPTLGVAEFAPTANKAVEPPPTTAGDLGGPARSGPRRTTTTTASASTGTSTADSSTGATAPTTRSPRARPCVGNPPRQTEDPMSPACLATIFEGDNGGVTSTGVSATEIRVAVPGQTGSWSAASRREALNALFEHFNRRFEFYGRRLVPVVVEGSASEATASRALGATVAVEQVFAAATGYLESDLANNVRASQPALIQELARNSIVTVARNAGPGWSDRLMFDPYNPYVWAVYPSAETNQDNLVSFACSALTKRSATHALEAGLRTKPRRFAVVAIGHQATPSITRLVEGLSACDEAPLTLQVSNGSSTADIRTGFEKLRAAGATTLVCICEGMYGYYTATGVASALGYGPEWLVLPSPFMSDELVPQWVANRASFIRLESGPRLLPLQSRPWFGALLESGSQVMQASDTTRRDGYYVSQPLYEGLLLLATGIQGAGPTLTPETFAQALMTTTFPNPGAGQAPYYQPSAGFGPGDHAFYDDYAVAWWSDTAPAVEPFSGSPQGSWCYLDTGARYRVGQYPADADEQLFNPAWPCR